MLKYFEQKKVLHIHFIFIILSTLCQTMSMVCAKFAALNSGDKNSVYLYFNIYYMLLLVCLVLQAYFWNIALKKYELSFAYPFMSLTFIFNTLLSWLIFDELIIPNMIVGLIIIFLGMVLLFGGADDKL